jgi:hypothetical protein
MDAIPELRTERRGPDREPLSILVRPPVYMDANRWTLYKDGHEYMDSQRPSALPYIDGDGRK